MELFKHAKCSFQSNLMKLQILSLDSIFLPHHPFSWTADGRGPHPYVLHQHPSVGGGSSPNDCSPEIDMESTNAALRTVTGNPDQTEKWAPDFLSVFITTTQLCQTLRLKVNGVSRGIYINQTMGVSEAEPSHLKDVLTKVKLSLTSHWVCTNLKMDF